MDIWSVWTVIGKTVAALDWMWFFLIASAVVSAAIGIGSWLTASAPRRPRSAQRRGVTAKPDESHDRFRSAA